MTAEQMWQLYGGCGEYDAWAFGDDADTLAALVLKGKKTATASAHCVYELEGEELPQAGQYSVVLNSKEEAVCVIRTESVQILPFCQVGAEFAYLEGEGDRSLAYWQKVHRAFFTQELESMGLSFTEDMPVVMESFVRVYP